MIRVSILILTLLFSCVEPVYAKDNDGYQERHQGRKARAARAREVERIVEGTNKASAKNIRVCIAQRTPPGATSAQRVIIRNLCRKKFQPIRIPYRIPR